MNIRIIDHSSGPIAKSVSTLERNICFPHLYSVTVSAILFIFLEFSVILLGMARAALITSAES